VGAHARFLQLQGADAKDVDHLGTGRPEQASFNARERALLDYVKLLTLSPADVKDAHVQRLRDTGWSDEQIFEASFITSLFAFFNRMADAYGLDYPPTGWLPVDQRPAASPEATAPGGKPAATESRPAVR
jgi:alkylhydroperoxidase family enzyme